MASSPSTFPKFPQLPIEVRLMIWNHSAERRVVTLAEKQYPKWWNGSQTPVQQNRPVLLDVCHESRELALKKYGSVFTQKTEGWKWEGSKKSKDLRTVLLALGLPRGGCIYNMFERISRYLNDPEERNSSPKFASCGAFSLHPIWFDVSHDILLLNSPRYGYRWGHGFSAALWGPWSSYESTKLYHVAFDLPNYIYGPPPPPQPVGTTVSPSPWLERILSTLHPPEFPVKTDFSTKVESITLLLRDAAEIITITLDESGLLQPGEWSYALDTQTQVFKETMGVHWSRVTWKVCLAKNRDHTLWQIAEAWRPATYVWKDQQKLMCEENNDIEGMWKTVNRRYGRFFNASSQPIPLKDGDGKTYLGP